MGPEVSRVVVCSVILFVVVGEAVVGCEVGD